MFCEGDGERGCETVITGAAAVTEGFSLNRSRSALTFEVELGGECLFVFSWLLSVFGPIVLPSAFCCIFQESDGFDFCSVFVTGPLLNSTSSTDVVLLIRLAASARLLFINICLHVGRLRNLGSSSGTLAHSSTSLKTGARCVTPSVWIVWLCWGGSDALRFTTSGTGLGWTGGSEEGARLCFWDGTMCNCNFELAAVCDCILELGGASGAERLGVGRVRSCSLWAAAMLFSCDLDGIEDTLSFFPVKDSLVRSGAERYFVI